MSEVRDEFRRGWRVVLAAGIGVGCGISLQQYVGSLFVKALQADLGWSRGKIAQAQGAALAAIFVAPILGWLIDKVGVRPVAMVSIVLLALVYLGLAAMPPSLGAFYGLFALLVILGCGTGPIGYTRAVNTWFEKGRGLSLGLTLTGVSLVAALSAPTLSFVIAHHGWRGGYAALAALSLVVALPTVFFALWERPRLLAKQGAGEIEIAAAKRVAQIGLTAGQTLKTGRFWILALAILLATAGLTGVISQLQPILTDQGLDAGVAGWMLALLAVSVMLGRIVVGWAVDRFWAPIPAAIALVLPALGVGLLAIGHGQWPLAVLAVLLIGAAQGGEVDVAAFFVARYFGMRSYGAVYALLGIAISLGVPIGAIGFGALYDHDGGYGRALAIAAAGFVASGALILLMGRYPQWNTPETKA
ncbi:MFS transporter [Caulobacter hibisci]|uniref:MFS transporter n=1 Tax=Caulobacter hibisci TaxID=2035993 RepID=A0ABS0STY9_9CAUL|nr:MFS transporter [Caulobacter hibisci]